MKMAADLRNAVETLVQAANYSYTRADFAVLRRRLAQAGVLYRRRSWSLLMPRTRQNQQQAAPLLASARQPLTAIVPASYPAVCPELAVLPGMN